MGIGYTWFAASIAGFGSVLYGYDSIIIASTFAQQGFYATFNPDATVLGAFVSTYFAGTCVAMPIMAYLSDKISRRWTMLVTAVIGLIGAIMQASANTKALFFVGRVLGGAAAAALLPVATYQAEIAPPNLRGAMIGFQFLTLTVAGSVGAWIGYGTNFSSNLSFAWRFPLAFQVVPAMGIIIGVWFIPFSPRWLIMKGRHEEAKTVLRRLHDDHKDSTFWEKEYLQIEAQLEVERAEKEGRSVYHILTNASERRRMLMAVLVIVSCQTLGAQTIQQYQAPLYTGLGFGTRMILLMTGVFQLCLNAGNFVNLFALDRVGRKFLFLAGLVSCSILLSMFIVCTKYYGETGSKAWGRAGVAVVMVFAFFFGATYMATPYAYATECLPTKIRAVGMGIAFFAGTGVTVIFSQTSPLAMEALTWKYAFVFIACNIVSFGLIWFYVPETKGLTLEEVSAAFGEKVELSLDQIQTTAIESFDVRSKDSEA